MTDRGFAIAFSVSVGLHIGLLMAQLPKVGWRKTPEEPPPLEVIYEYELAKEELRRLKEQLAKEKRAALAAPEPTGGVGQPRIRVPERPVLTAEQALPELLPGRSAIVDLTNLLEAAQGNPVLLSYYSAIREQIQRTANRRTWMTGEGQGGVVHVSFVLLSSGQVYSAAIVGDRSAPSKTLRKIALNIVRAASPFHAFPPSMAERMKTIIVPLEFLLGSEPG